ncbi:MULTISPECIES: type II toxin-antitoxin system YafO family toxin [Marinobacter]|uniref:type II toxin-antitoxin system YafO family toxin n=1 Tax=Marinobacter TaxID=2742 RepID=UPI00294333FA|nr:type II toxin-antitoxin system YafO family toxin [Marinobacter salarius]WOI19620.1 type II toxin-antitoxin system YafO family toxin [Marinobacter salarius]
MVEVYTSGLIKKQYQDKGELEQLDALILDFEDYKRTGMIPQHFGRDELYDHPHTLSSVRMEELQHLHLLDPANGPIHAVQFRRTSDIHLVYCQGAMNDDCYLLLAVLEPDAHEQARNRNIMTNLATIAGKFRDQN